MKAKTVLRKQLQGRLRSVNSIESRSWTLAIEKRLSEVLAGTHDQLIHIYKSATSLHEPTTSKLVVQLQQFGSVTVGSGLYDEPIPNERYDLIIVPLLGFDSDCHRLGRGSGWYDRFLSQQSTATKIGLSYELSRCNTVPVEPHDITLDMIITERQVYRARH